MLDCFCPDGKTGATKYRARDYRRITILYTRLPLRLYVEVLKRKAVDSVEKATSSIGSRRCCSSLSVIEIITAAAAVIEITIQQQDNERYAQPRSKGQLVVLVQHGVQQK